MEEPTYTELVKTLDDSIAAHERSRELLDDLINTLKERRDRYRIEAAKESA